MNELKEILESSVLSDEVKTKLQEAFENQVKTEVAKREVEIAESAEKQKQDLAQATVEMIEEAVTEEFKAIQDEIVEARSLDVRYAIKLEEFKEQYAEAKSKELEEQVQSILSEEMDELKESLEVARNNIAGQRMFEAFQGAYGELLSEGQEVDYKEKLEEAQKENEELRADKKLNELLEGLTGRKRNVMASLMEGVAVDKMDERFEELSKNILLKETVEEDKEEESLEESEKEEKDTPKGTVVFESSAEDDDKDAEKRRQEWLKRSRRMAGLD